MCEAEKFNIVSLISGIAGLQWRKHLPASVQVFINDKSEMAIETMLSSCEKNEITVSSVHREGLVRTRNSSGEHMKTTDPLKESSTEVHEELVASIFSFTKASVDLMQFLVQINFCCTSCFVQYVHIVLVFKLEIIQDDANVTMHRKQFHVM